VLDTKRRGDPRLRRRAMIGAHLGNLPDEIADVAADLGLH
jgi:hypothetical protein